MFVYLFNELVDQTFPLKVSISYPTFETARSLNT